MMFGAILGMVRGSLSLTLYLCNTVFWCMLLFIMAAVKAAVPVNSWQKVCSRVLNAIAENWVSVNILIQDLLCGIRWDIQGIEAMERSEWHLVLANHQSWVDIVVLQRIFHRKIPFLKFFIKKELFWFPILGQAWWALDFPFLKRYTKSFLQKNPHLIGKDLEITRKACAKFKRIPISIINFVEGSRFTKEKHRTQQSPYDHLLKPKAGGIAIVLGSMGESIHRVLDVTIVYQGGPKNFWALLSGNIRTVKVRVRSIPVSPELLGDYTNNEHYRKGLQRWLNNLWEDKDRVIEELMTS